MEFPDVVVREGRYQHGPDQAGTLLVCEQPVT